MLVAHGIVMACAKHYALNSMENARFSVDVTCDEATLHERRHRSRRPCVRSQGRVVVPVAEDNVAQH